MRHVEAPSRLFEIESWRLKRINQPIPPFRLPKATLAADCRVAIDYVDQRRATLGGYCRHPDPSQQEMTDVTAALVNQLVAGQGLPAALRRLTRQPGARGKVSRKVEIVAAVRSEFDFVVQDDIIGFDGHPGPFWHYAISRKLLAGIAWQQL